MALLRLEPEAYITEIPRFPDFPYAEWKKRIERAQKLMQGNGIDAVVVWKRENVRYYFGFQTTHWEFPTFSPAVGIIPAEGDPILIVAGLLLINAQAYCWTKNIWYQPDPHDPVRQRELPVEVAKVIKDGGLGKKNIALEMGPLGHMWIPRPLNDIEAFRNALPNARFVDGDKVIWGCRMIKSPFEIERIRQAVRVTALCHQAVVEKFRPGMSEMDVGKIIHHVEVDSGDFRGGDSVIACALSCNPEKEGICDALAEDDLPIGRNDYGKVDIQHRHKGYWADIARCFQFGPIPDKINRAYDICEEGIRSAEARIRSGIAANELQKAAIKPVVESGFESLSEAGHGIGMDVHEPPMLMPNSDTILQENMVLSIEVWVRGLRRLGGTGHIGIEEHYVVTDKGFEKIPGFDAKIRQVRHPFS